MHEFRIKGGISNEDFMMASFLKMHKIFKYVLDMRDLGMKLELNRNNKESWDIVCFSNSDYT